MILNYNNLSIRDCIEYMKEQNLITESNYFTLMEDLQEMEYCTVHFYDEEGDENE